MDFPDVRYGRIYTRVVPPPGSYGEAINVFFDRVTDILPVWVGKQRAVNTSIAISGIVLLIALPFVNELRRVANTPLDRIQLGGTVLGLLISVMVLQDKIMGFLHKSAMISANAHHFAAAHWIGEYSKAIRS